MSLEDHDVLCVAGVQHSPIRLASTERALHRAILGQREGVENVNEEEHMMLVHDEEPAVDGCKEHLFGVIDRHDKNGYYKITTGLSRVPSVPRVPSVVGVRMSRGRRLKRTLRKMDSGIP